MKLSLKGGLFFIIGKVKHVCRDALNDVYEIGLEFWDKPKTFAKKFYEELEGIMDYRRRYKEEGGGEISLAEASLNWYKDTSE